MEFLLASVLFLVIGTCASDFCNTCDSKNEYCEFGCCGEGETKRCCENKIAIGIGTAFGGLVLILVASGAFLYLMQRRYYKEKQFVHQTEASTQYDNDPLSVKGTVYLIGSDNRVRRVQVERSTEIQDEERNNNQHEVINEEN